MSFLPFPDLMFDRYDELTPDHLKRKGIRPLLSHLDNTLALAWELGTAHGSGAGLDSSLERCRHPGDDRFQQSQT